MLEAVLATLISQTNPGLSSLQVKSYSSYLVKESRAQKIDPYIFYAIVHMESRWHSNAIGHEKDGSCWVGLGQIRVPGCDPEKVQPLYDPIYNLHRSAIIQREAKKWCKMHVCKGGWLRLYNNSAKYVAEVQRIAKEARRVEPGKEPSVGAVRGLLHVP